MRWLVFLLAIAPALVFADTWRWVDENGVVNYSDTPHPGAERVDLRVIQTTPFAERSRSAEASEPAEAGETSGGSSASYDSVSILRPQPEETLWNLEGQLDVQVSVQPEMQSDHRLKLYLDGTEVVGIPAGATSFTIDRVFRGMHTLRASVQDQSGRQLGASEAIRFYVQQTSVQNPQGGPPRPTPLPTPRPRPRG
jgi:hypothetical protein